MREKALFFLHKFLSFLTHLRFSVQGWTHTSGNTSVPVVVEARPQNASNLTGRIIHSYSFIDFYFVDPEFRVQREMWCWGAVYAPPLPKLPRRFDVNLEYLYADSGRIWASRVGFNIEILIHIRPNRNIEEWDVLFTCLLGPLRFQKKTKNKTKNVKKTGNVFFQLGAKVMRTQINCLA